MSVKKPLIIKESKDGKFVVLIKDIGNAEVLNQSETINTEAGALNNIAAVYATMKKIMESGKPLSSFVNIKKRKKK